MLGFTLSLIGVPDGGGGEVVQMHSRSLAAAEAFNATPCIRVGVDLFVARLRVETPRNPGLAQRGGEKEAAADKTSSGQSDALCHSKHERGAMAGAHWIWAEHYSPP